MELAQIFAAFGVRVTLLKADLRILEPADEEIARMPEAWMLRQEISLALDAHVSRICHAGGGAFVQYRDQAGVAHQAYGEYVLPVAGYEARTDEPGLYAVGDVIGRPLFVCTGQARSRARLHAIFWDSPRAFRIRQ